MKSKNTPTLYIWGGSLIGHASLLGSKRYFSYHAMSGSKLAIIPGYSEKARFTNLDDDLDYSDREFTLLGINNVQGEEIDESIGEFRKNIPEYNLFGANCSTTIAAIILSCIDEEQGNELQERISNVSMARIFSAAVFDTITSDADIAALTWRKFFGWKDVWSPNDVRALVLALNEIG